MLTDDVDDDGYDDDDDGDDCGYAIRPMEVSEITNSGQNWMVSESLHVPIKSRSRPVRSLKSLGNVRHGLSSQLPGDQSLVVNYQDQCNTNHDHEHVSNPGPACLRIRAIVFGLDTVAGC